GLTSAGKYISDSRDIVIDFPFKDCVLEGGMTKEDVGINEVYYNEIIAQDEIDRLLSPKALTKIKKYTTKKTHNNINSFNYENIIIKGNNLIALHCLKSKYAGKVKLIYIDPPYNTENDSFQYNDRFTRSTWLTFIKNRISVARDLLSNDGIICVQLDENEVSYCKILLNDIFGEDNFRNEIIVRRGTKNVQSQF
ncbi:site-specific DNA-methyltransferase, partial [Escherichia coli]